MADRLDVAEHLAEGRPAVEHTQRYVRASQMLGYQHVDLTAHPSQVCDWYDSEDGLDLRALDSDCAQLRAAAAAATEALRVQRAQIAELEAAWTGPGAESAIWFLQRHCDAANLLCSEVRAAAQRCESLRDNVWQLVDGKVATTIDIDDRSQSQRPAWLAAVDAVTTGTGDRTTADEVIRREIKPYVDNDIRIEWLTAMRSAQAGVAASYDMVADRLAAAPEVAFEIPGELGPGGPPLRPAPAPPPIASAPAVAPAFASVAPDLAPPATPASAPPASAPQDFPQVAPAADLEDSGTSLGDGSAMAPAGGGGLGGLDGMSGLEGMSGLSGLSGLANRIVDAMSGLLGSTADELPDPSAFDEGAADEADPAPYVEEEGPDEVEAEPVAETAQAKTPPGEAAGEAVPPPGEAAPAAGQPPPAAPAASPGGAPPAVVPPPAVAPPPVKGPPPGPSGGATPCQIAADELPQAGQ
jgi:hypothetical protein